MEKWKQISGNFWLSEKTVFYGSHRLALDPTKTRVFFGTWATDGKRFTDGSLRIAG